MSTKVPRISTKGAKPKVKKLHNPLQLKSPVTKRKRGGKARTFGEEEEIIFDYNVFIAGWQDRIKMRHYRDCERYCQTNLQKLYKAEQIAERALKRSQRKGGPQPPFSKEDTKEGYNYREYRSKVHFSFAYLLKKYLKKHDEARRQYKLAITCDPENPGSSPPPAHTQMLECSKCTARSTRVLCPPSSPASF